MTRQEIIRAILGEYEERRYQNQKEQQQRIAEACAMDAEIARLRNENRELAFSTMRKVVSSNANVAETARTMKERGLQINREIRTRLQNLGLPQNYLQEQYRCDLCRDTGYTGEAPAHLCTCVESEARRRMVNQLSEQGFCTQSFESFDENVVPEENGQRRQLAAVRDFCLDYIEQWPNSPYRNLLLTGEGGLGKTFLLNCVYTRAMEKGIAALRVSAYRMLEAMRTCHLGSDSERGQDFDAMLEAPLLFIDDLGTEPMLRNITVEYLFALLNERVAAGRHTMVATNLSPLQLQERYGERVSSRLLDRSVCSVIQLKGKDIRRACTM